MAKVELSTGILSSWADGWRLSALGFYGIFLLPGIFFLASWALERAVRKARCPDASASSPQSSEDDR